MHLVGQQASYTRVRLILVLPSLRPCSGHELPSQVADPCRRLLPIEDVPRFRHRLHRRPHLLSVPPSSGPPSRPPRVLRPRLKLVLSPASRPQTTTPPWQSRARRSLSSVIGRNRPRVRVRSSRRRCTPSTPCRSTRASARSRALVRRASSHSLSAFDARELTARHRLVSILLALSQAPTAAFTSGTASTASS